MGVIMTGAIPNIDNSEMPQRREYWTSWFNTDTPTTGEGDEETAKRVESFYGPICRITGYTIKSAQCTDMVTHEIFDQHTSGFAPDILHNPCTVHGLECNNADQQLVNGVRQCTDYAVRFRCGHELGEDAEDAFFPQFDVRIYIILAIIPILIFLVRILWSYVFRKRRQRREARNPSSRNSESGSTDDDDLFSITSGLASPPPSYQQLFGDANTSQERSSLVFSITGRSLHVCAKCDSKPCGIATSISNSAQTQAFINDSVPYISESNLQSVSSTISESNTHNTISDNAQVFNSNTTTESPPFVHQIIKSHGEEVGLLINDFQTSRSSTSSNPATEPTTEAQGESQNTSILDNEMTDSSSSLENLTDSSSSDNEQNQTPILSPLEATHSHISEPCACACHRTISFLDTAVRSYTNDSFIHDEGPSIRRTTHFPGMHTPVPGLQRVWSNLSMLSIASVITQSELPSYEAALDILKSQEIEKEKCASTFL